VLAALKRLASKGAHAAPAEPAPGRAAEFAVFTARDAYAKPVATIATAIVELASRRGWLDRIEGGARYRISASGIEVLRRARSGTASQDAAPGRKLAPSASTARVVSLAPGTAAPAEGSLAWLRRRKDKNGRPLLTDAQFAAGERLGSDFWRARLTPRVTADWTSPAAGHRQRRSAPGAGVDMSDGMLAARERVHRAVDAVGPELAGILVDVCCREIGLEPAGKAQGWPQRAAKVVLQLALARLARHYGMLPADASVAAGRLRHWGDDDYRPTLDVWR
jgi:hypothetical protein